jgi:hypothetical protein
MVQPLPSVAASGRPDGSVPVVGHRPLTPRKYEDFRTHLARLSERPAPAQPSPVTLEAALPRSVPTEAEIAPRLESLPSLAPEDQPSLGRGGSEVAEWFSLINPTGGVEVPATAPAQPAAPPGVAEVAELVERWVRRAALGGDQRRGAVRLDIGQGRFSGAEVLVVAEAGHVSVELQLPANLVEGDLSERLRTRLERRGYAADVVVR